MYIVAHSIHDFIVNAIVVAAMVLVMVIALRLNHNLFVCMPSLKAEFT